MVKASDGVESTFRLTDHAARDGGKDIGEGMEKGAKVTVYYTEDEGEKVAGSLARGHSGGTVGPQIHDTCRKWTAH